MADLIARPDPEPHAALDDREANERLRARYAEIAQLAGGLAHEIRNPLSTMSLNLDLLAEEFQGAETNRDRRALQKIERLRRDAPVLNPALSSCRTRIGLAALVRPDQMRQYVRSERRTCAGGASRKTDIIYRALIRP